MICKSCKEKLSTKVKFCPECGAAAKQSSATFAGESSIEAELIGKGKHWFKLMKRFNQDFDPREEPDIVQMILEKNFMARASEVSEAMVALLEYADGSPEGIIDFLKRQIPGLEKELRIYEQTLNVCLSVLNSYSDDED